MRRGMFLAASLTVCAVVAGVLGGLAHARGGHHVVESVSAETVAEAAVPLQGTVWLLERFGLDGATAYARPNLNSTLVIQRDGQFLLRSCNNVFGTVSAGVADARFDGGSNTERTCPGLAGDADAAVREALRGRVSWTIRERNLTVVNLDNAAELDFRVRDSAQPPTDAVVVATLDDGVHCRLMLGATEDGPRLYALARTRAEGPWRLIADGPAAPGEGPLLAPEFVDAGSGHSCVGGFAPENTLAVRFRQGPARPDASLALYRVPGIDAPVYAGVITVSTPAPEAAGAKPGLAFVGSAPAAVPVEGEVIATDRSQHPVASWSTEG